MIYDSTLVIQSLVKAQIPRKLIKNPHIAQVINVYRLIPNSFRGKDHSNFIEQLENLGFNRDFKPGVSGIISRLMYGYFPERVGK